jgi:hypothetical protein
VINNIKTPQQYELFENFQRLADQELPTHKKIILAPVKPVYTIYARGIKKTYKLVWALICRTSNNHASQAKPRSTLKNQALCKPLQAKLPKKKNPFTTSKPSHGRMA